MTDQELNAKFDALFRLVTDVKESLEREIHGVRDQVDRMAARLDKIAAGAHYVTRLVEWSEKLTPSRPISCIGCKRWKESWEARPNDERKIYSSGKE